MVAPYEDRIQIATPEGVALELVLAGMGSRMAARLLDTLVQAAFGLCSVMLISLEDSWGPLVAVGYVGVFATMFLYDPVFEAMGSGRTPGKRWAGLRVVRLDGGPAGWGTTSVRNVLRIVDLLPGTYLVGIVCLFVTSRNQRIGDLVAGTIVVRERRGSTVTLDQLTAAVAPSLDPGGPRWDTSGITDEELALVRSFLQRRGGITPAARHSIAVDLDVRLRPRAVGAPSGLAPEALLEQLVAQRAASS